MASQSIPVEGGLYIIRSGSGFGIVKVLRLEDEVVHLRVYKNKYAAVPAKVNPTTLTLGTIHDKDGFGVGHQPTRLKAFLSWKPQFLQHSLVEPEELDGYEYWKAAGGGVWG